MNKKLLELLQKVEKKIAEQKESLVKLEAGSEDENKMSVSFPHPTNLVPLQS